MANFCSSCGEAIGEGYAFCPKCGNKIGENLPVPVEESVSIRKKKDFVENFFIHDADRMTLQTLKAIPGFSQLMKGFMKIWNEKIFRIQNMSTHLRISEKQLPKYHKMLCEICEKLGIDVPEMYMELNDVPNAYTYGDTKPFIVLTTGLIETMPEELIPTVIAHECGHIVCHHCLYHTMGSLLFSAADALAVEGIITGSVMWSLKGAFYTWMRCSEFSADRVAVLCDGKSENIVKMCMYFSGYSKRFDDEPNPEEFMNQAREYRSIVKDSGWNKVLETALIFETTHPLNAVRALENHEWASTERFEQVATFLKEYRDNDTVRIADYLTEAPVPESAKYFHGKNYNEVKAIMQSLGFENIKIYKNYHKKIMIKNNQVIDISIKGNNDFGRCEWFPLDSEVIIEYYSET